MIPRLIISRLPMISSRRITVAKPLTARPVSFRYKVSMPRRTDKPRKITPANVTKCNGKDEKAVIPVRASFRRLNTDQADLPAQRGTTSKGICTVVKPIQTVIPRKNTLRSCIFNHASTALRFISLKSDAHLKWNPDNLVRIKKDNLAPSLLDNDSRP